ncbi:indole-3-glycerol phosphate synthase TrpC [Plebeiibacterium sediminum]|uniref:indole-3-glycerol-phosphate synthase n=1 Tax=Plebeiibacterium sediminum TaxID=2992112 RepID=A0AAE3M2W2_9BACT|nr:indole-3-glycerol phosphate synthase TrpC [Plebeiobacterium sediminum]MCW3786094.1 indole-3-glycerol phosphate synthase TrpC [Plebeiobacterium sediminum]
MNILDKIVAKKKIEVEQQQEFVTLDKLKGYSAFNKEVPSLKQYLSDGNHNGIISEYKRKSPSKGIINSMSTVEDVVPLYEKAGVSGISVLTDSEFFGGNKSDLVAARKVTTVPILRKDFMISSYQVYEAKAIGASAILLIAAILTYDEANELSKLAKDLGLDILMEVHSKEELDIVNPLVDVVGVNNRNLKTFEVSLQQSIDLAAAMPNDVVKISESGIYTPEDIFLLRENGFKGFLIGENFMRTKNPGQACIEFSNAIK